MIQVSSRTVLRELNNVDKWFEANNFRLEKKKGIGIKIDFENHNAEDIAELLNGEETELTYSPQQRLTILKAELLKENEITKLYTLTRLFNVTESTISNDLDQIGIWVEKFNIQLIRKPGLGIYIKGNEKTIRKAIIALLYEHFHEIDLINYIIRNEAIRQDNHSSVEWALCKNKINGVLFDFMEIDCVAIVKEMLKDLEVTMGYQLADSAYIALMIRFIATLKRVKQNFSITIDENIAKEYKHKKVFIFIKTWCSEHPQMNQLDDSEIVYLTMHIMGAKQRGVLLNNSIASMVDDYKMIKLAKLIIKVAQAETKVYLEDNQKLLQGLVRHLGPAIERIKLDLDIMNPLLEDIKEKYPDLFLATSKCAKVIEEKENIIVPEDEIAYLATHIGAAIRTEQRRFNNKYRVVIACTNGIGTSRLLVSEIEKEFPNIDIVETVSTIEFNEVEVNRMNIDLIIATVPMTLTKLPYILVNSILSQADIKNIKNYLESLSPNEKRISHKKTVNLKAKLEELNGYSKTIIDILDHYFYFDKVEVININELIYFVSHQLLKGEDLVSRLINEFKDREEKGSTILGERGMMLLHTRSSVINHLYVMVVKPSQPIVSLGSQNELVNIELVIVMVAPINCSSIGIETLGEISKRILTKEFSRVLKEGSREEIFTEMSNILDEFYQKKVIASN
jgi:mannitol operon transcriptional antiterminator